MRVTPKLPPLIGIHHIKIPVSDLDRSLRFYETAFGATRIPQWDHRSEHDGTLYAYILDFPGLGCKVELRLNPRAARRLKYFDTVTIAVKDRATLALWATHLAEKAIPHSPVITAIQAWLIVVEGPDHYRLRLYTLETHGPEVEPDEDNPWLSSGEG
jgi:catechol 2,3-dioxygenase-like lactoylglutathione lyase family enzyme